MLPDSNYSNHGEYDVALDSDLALRGNLLGVARFSRGSCRSGNRLSLTVVVGRAS
jgi:hypothetical protein